MGLTRNTILIIDDDDVVRDSIAVYLRGCRFNSLEAESGEQGLAVLREHVIDLILCDLRMPRMSGLDVLRNARILSPDIPFIVISGASVMTDVVEALRLGANDYIIKPVIDLKVLEYAINRALDNAQLVQENRRYRESLESAIYSLENSLHLLQADLKIGRQMQMNMLPKGPLHHAGYRFDHHIFPSLYLSGDFVDYFLLDEQYIAFYLADVAGHGASSAFVTILLKYISTNLLLKYQAYRKAATVKPSYALSFINKNLLCTPLGKHVTMFSGIVDTCHHTLTYSFGGHYPLPIIASNGEVRFIEGKGLPLGLSEEATFDDVTMDLPQPFSLAILSDGILEVLPQKPLRDKENYLLSVIGDNADSAATLIDKLRLGDLAEAPDDIALLTLARS